MLINNNQYLVIGAYESFLYINKYRHLLISKTTLLNNYKHFLISKPAPVSCTSSTSVSVEDVSVSLPHIMRYNGSKEMAGNRT